MALLKKFGAAIGFVLALVGFVLVSATDGVTIGTALGDANVASKYILFGADNSKVVVVELIGWILALVALIALLAVVVGTLAKVGAIEKLSGLLGLCAGCALILAGVLVFFVVPAFMGTNELKGDGYGITAGWVIGGILLVGGGCLAVLPKFVK